MWKNQFLPVYKSDKKGKKWRFLPKKSTNIEIAKNSLKIKISIKIKKEETIFIALTFPYGFDKQIKFNKNFLQHTNKLENIFVT